MNKPIISEDLQSFIRQTSLIKNVYFDEFGRHYFNVFQLRKDRNDTTKPENWSFYGTGIFSHQQVIPGIHNVDKKKESIAKGDSSTLIVQILSREDILSSDVKKAGNSQAVNIFNSTEGEKQLMRESLFSKEVLAMLDAIATGKLTVVPTQHDEEDVKLV